MSTVSDPVVSLWCDTSLTADSQVAGALATAVARAARDIPAAARSPRPTDIGVVAFDDCAHAQELIARLQARAGRILAISARPLPATGSAHWQLLRAGADDVVVWSDNSLDTVIERLRRWIRIEELARTPALTDHLAGDAPAWRVAVRQAVEVSAFSSAPVLVTGPSGSGKEGVARLIHELSPTSREGTFVIVDCTTVVPSLSGSEFFGHEKGAFTGAVAVRDGAFALASGGTLFLDEVGELPLTLQAELLRVVQEGTFKRVGSNTWNQTSFRLVCATNRDLATEQEQGTFRKDFYYRLAAATVTLPALDDRPDDILPIARHLLASLRPDLRDPGLEPVVADVLTRRRYPGNVRELRQLLFRMAARHAGTGPLTIGDLPVEERAQPDTTIATPNAADSPRADRPAIESVPSATPDRASPDGPPIETDRPACMETLAAAARQAGAAGMTLNEVREAALAAAIAGALEAENHSLRRAAKRLGISERALQQRRANARVQHPNPSPATGQPDRTGFPR
jgi:DNA-binding NtrC family response regulator